MDRVELAVALSAVSIPDPDVDRAIDREWRRFHPAARPGRVRERQTQLANIVGVDLRERAVALLVVRAAVREPDPGLQVRPLEP